MSNNIEDNDTTDFIEEDFHDEDFAHDSSADVGPEEESRDESPQKNTNPLFKFLILVIAVFAVIAAAMKFFSTDDKTSLVTKMTPPPTMREAPGGASSPYHQQQTKMADDMRVQEAIKYGESAMPTPIGNPTERSDVGGFNRKEDPLRELRAEQELLRRQLQQAQQKPPEPFDPSLARIMQRYMESLAATWTPSKMAVIQGYGEEAGNATGQQGYGGGGGGYPPQSYGAGANNTLVRVGTISYAQLLTEANSDVPGPVLAQIVSGPLSGAKAIGSFQVAYGYERYLVLRFRVATKGNKEYQIDAIALDPDTSLSGMATEVDERYMTRLVLPAAANFLQVFGSGMGTPDRERETSGRYSSVVSQSRQTLEEGLYSGLGGAFETAGEFFRDEANRTKPLVRVAAGTPMGLLFTSSVSASGGAPAGAALNAGAAQRQQQAANPPAPRSTENSGPYSPRQPSYAPAFGAPNPGGGFPSNYQANQGMYGR